ncbi:glycosyltransferase [Coriobacteriales bacterium OH1046]|nr:glycosyltransferase [Coriobacteriales bacterium OH1046]
MDRPAIVIVTYKRQDLLAGLLASIEKSTVAPWRIVVVDNEGSPETARMLERFSDEVDELWPATGPDALGGTSRAVYVPMAENTGGSGGFSAGVERAHALGAQWFWVMDDDVAIEPEGLARLDAWTAQADVIQGCRYDFDGGPFYWQYHLWLPLGIYNPLARSSFEGERFKSANVMCFEGALFSRRVVDTCGLPDPRFFIYWDDAVYGYVASRHLRTILVPDFVLRRCRAVKNVAVGSVRQLNSTSDMTRYYILRNRGYIARYLQRYGDYRRIAFGVGTALTFAKELIRIVAVDRTSLVSGIKRMVEGWRDARTIYRDPTWEPMPPLG